MEKQTLLDACIAGVRQKNTLVQNAGSQDHEELKKMGKMIIVYKINPTEQEKARECLELIKSTKFSGELKDVQITSPGFGIKIIKAAFLLPDKVEDAIENLTKEITKLELVEDAEVEGMNLL